MKVRKNGIPEVQPISGGGSGGTSAVDDSAFTVAVDSVNPMGGVFTTDTVDAGDVGALAMDASRRLLVSIEADNVGIGGGTQYTEDAAAAADPVGTAQNLIRLDTPATLTSADGDNVARRGTNYGAAYTQLVTSSGSFIDSVGGGTEYTEDVAAASPVVGTATLVIRDDALSAVTPAEGDNIPLRGTAEGSLWTQDANSDAILADTTAILAAQLPDGHAVTVDNASGAAAVNIQDGGNAITVDWAGTAPPVGAGVEATALRVTVATDSTGVLSVDDNSGSLTVDNATISVVGGGTEAAAQRVTIANDSTGVLPVTGTFFQTTQPVSGTFFQTTQPVSAATLPLPSGAATAAAQLADGHNVVVTSAPSTAVTNAGTFVTQAAATLQAGTAHAGTVEAVETPESVRWGGVVETKLDAFLNATSTGNTALVAAGGAGFKHVVLKAFIVNTAATSHVVHFESATTAITPNIEAGADGGGGEYPIQFETGDNEALNFNLTGAGTVGVHINYITVAV